MGAADPITNEQAVHTLYAEHREWLQDWLRRRLGSVDDAADLSQDTFVRVLTFSDARTIDEPKAYLATLARRLLSSFWRRRALEASWLDVLARQPLAVAPSAEDEALLREAIESIDRMLDGLPLRCRQAFLLNRLEGMAHTAIAAHMGVSLATVERDVRRAGLHCQVGDAAAPVARIRDIDARHEGIRQASYQVLTERKTSPSRARRRALQGGLAMLVLGSGGIVLNEQLPPRSLLADWHTRTAERRRIALADGSVLTLDARSGANYRISASARELTLLGGQCMIEVDARPQPFVLRSGPARLQASGDAPARILARRGESDTSIALLTGHARWFDPSGMPHALAVGQSLAWRHGDAHIEIGTSSDAQAAWTDGVLDVRDAPLGEVVAALRPYQHGLIRISTQAAALRVFGVFPLDEPQRALRMLADALPIAVRRFSGWITWIDAR